MSESRLKTAVAASASFPSITLEALEARWAGSSQWETAVGVIRGGDLRLAWVGAAHVEGFVHSKKARWLFYFTSVRVAADGALTFECCCMATCVRS